jgi:hypothetical protein
VIVNGHAVVEAMTELGEDQVAVVVCASRDPAEIRAIPTGAPMNFVPGGRLSLGGMKRSSLYRPR